MKLVPDIRSDIEGQKSSVAATAKGLQELSQKLTTLESTKVNDLISKLSVLDEG